MSRVLVYQANGVQGGATVRCVQQAGYQTRVLIRNGSKASNFMDTGVEVAIADLSDRDALVRAHKGIDYCILQVPVHKDAFVAEAIDNAVVAMESARIKGAILKLSNPTSSQWVADTGFSANRILLDRMRESNIPFSAVEPTMYLDTFLKRNLRDEIMLEHVIDLPLVSAMRVAWTTVDDAARMAVQLLALRSFGRVLRCAGETAYDGPELANQFSAVLGYQIEYRGTGIEAFRRDMESAIGTVAAAPVVSKFDFLARYRDEARHMLSRVLEPGVLQGFTPTPIRDWVQQHRALFAAD